VFPVTHWYRKSIPTIWFAEADNPASNKMQEIRRLYMRYCNDLFINNMWLLPAIIANAPFKQGHSTPVCSRQFNIEVKNNYFSLFGTAYTFIFF